MVNHSLDHTARLPGGRGGRLESKYVYSFQLQPFALAHFKRPLSCRLRRLYHMFFCPSRSHLLEPISKRVHVRFLRQSEYGRSVAISPGDR